MPSDRCPLWNSTARQIKRWLQEQGPGRPEQLLFPIRKGGHLTRTTVTERLQLATEKAARRYPELARHKISPHVIRHRNASASGRREYHRDLALARTRESGDHTHVHRGRFGDEGGCSNMCYYWLLAGGRTFEQASVRGDVGSGIALLPVPTGEIHGGQVGSEVCPQRVGVRSVATLNRPWSNFGGAGADRIPIRCTLGSHSLHSIVNCEMGVPFSAFVKSKRRFVVNSSGYRVLLLRSKT